MKIDELDMGAKNALASQYRQDGMTVIPSIDLPDSFQPPITDLVFLNVEGTCEVYIGESATYQGHNRTWRQVGRNAPSPGRTRLVLTTRGDFFSGYGKIKSLIGEAGGAYVAQSAPADVPGPVTPIGSLSADQPVQAPVALATQHVPGPRVSPVRDVDTPLPENESGSPSSQPGEAHGGARNGGRSPLRNLVEECLRNPRDYAGREDVLLALKPNLVRETKPGVVLSGTRPCPA